MPELLTMHVTAAAARFQSRMQGYAEAVRRGGDQATRAQMASVRLMIVQSTPVDTGRLQRSWSPVVARGPLTWGVSTDRLYAPVLEYGGYARVGRSGKTVQLSGGPLGGGFVAGPGVYSRQAPLGFVRRALAEARDDYTTRLKGVIRQAWGKEGTGPHFRASSWVPGGGTSRLNLGLGQLETLFDIAAVTTLGAL